MALVRPSTAPEGKVEEQVAWNNPSPESIDASERDLAEGIGDGRNASTEYPRILDCAAMYVPKQSDRNQELHWKDQLADNEEIDWSVGFRD